MAAHAQVEMLEGVQGASSRIRGPACRGNGEGVGYDLADRVVVVKMMMMLMMISDISCRRSPARYGGGRGGGAHADGVPSARSFFTSHRLTYIEWKRSGDLFSVPIEIFLL